MRNLHPVKIAASALIAAVLVCACSSGAKKAQEKTPVDYVNPNIGYISHLLVPVYPMTHLPNSMVRVRPMRHEYMTDRVSGLPVTQVNHRGPMAFSINPWCGEYDESTQMMYDYDYENITPYHFSVLLDNVMTQVEYAPARRGGVYELEFLEEGKHSVIIKGDNILMEGNNLTASETFSGSLNPLTVYLYLQTSLKPESVRRLGGNRVALEFGEASKVDVRYAISFIDSAQARQNFIKEVDGMSVDQLAGKARDIWNGKLGKISVKGGTEDQKTVFYTSLYRIYERMWNMSEDNRYYSAYDATVYSDDRPYYVDDWIWDTYRAAHPLRTIIEPEMEQDMIQSYVRAAKHCPYGWLPTFPLPTGDSHSMNCNHGIAVIADAIAKGLTGFDVEDAYEAAKVSIDNKSLAPWSYQRPGILDEFYKKHGYYPSLKPGEKEFAPEINDFEKRQPVAVTLGTSYDQWCLAQIADHLGKEQERKHYLKRSFNYRNIFNPQTRFFHPKDSDGKFIEPFDYKFSGGVGFREAYDENNGWIYRWDVQHNIADLMKLMGGREAFAQALDDMYDGHMGVGKYECYVASPDHSALVGLYSMGNEPCMHIPYLYNYAGQPWKTQKRTRMLLDQWFRNDLMGIPGDEDGGGLTAFAAFSMMGFYPVTPGLPMYVLTSPVFEEVRIDVGGGKTFTIRCNNYGPENTYIQGATLNGELYCNSWIRHSDIVSGGVLELQMGRYPNKEWASEPACCPPSGAGERKVAKNPSYADFNWGQADYKYTEWVESIKLLSPECRSDVKGKVTVRFTAAGMDNARAFLWAAPDRKNTSQYGHDVELTPAAGLKISGNKEASFSFDADKFPAGPMNVRIYAMSNSGRKDYYELQLYNLGGVKWGQGMPQEAPAAAEGLTLTFADDFDGPLSISNDGRGARYNAHKPGGGDFSGWQFANVDGPLNPFFQRDTYLKIAARKPEGTKGSSGLIAPMDMDGNGLWCSVPCYMECRFTAQSAPGTWPAFWTLNSAGKVRCAPSGCDEIDIIEAYGGVGPGNPNHIGYSITSHYWGQTLEDGSRKPDHATVVPMMEVAGKSYFSTTFHTYGCLIGEEETVYYLDDVEVFRHPTNDLTKEYPHYFLINYAIGGISGWPINLERYGNGSDMYVDYVRVYTKQ